MKEEELFRRQEKEPYQPAVGDVIYIWVGDKLDRGEITETREEIDFGPLADGTHRKLEPFVEIDQSFQVHPSRVIDPEYTPFIDFLRGKMTDEELKDFNLSMLITYLDSFIDWGLKQEELRERLS